MFLSSSLNEIAELNGKWIFSPQGSAKKQINHSLCPSKLLSHVFHFKFTNWKPCFMRRNIASSCTSVTLEHNWLQQSKHIRTFWFCACNGEEFSFDYGVLGCLTCSDVFSHLFAPLLGHRNREIEQPEATKTKTKTLMAEPLKRWLGDSFDQFFLRHICFARTSPSTCSSLTVPWTW